MSEAKPPATRELIPPQEHSSAGNAAPGIAAKMVMGSDGTTISGEQSTASIAQQPKLVDTNAIQEELGEILGDISLPNDWRQHILQGVNRYNPEDNEQKRRQLQAQLERAKQLFIQGDLTGDEYKAEKMRVQAALSRLQPVTGPSLIDAGELLSDFSRIWGLANLAERKRLLRVSLEAAYYIERSAVTAIKPRPEFYNLIYRSCGPDGGWCR